VSLRGKTLLVLGTTLIALWGALYFVSRGALLRRFAILEEQEIRQDLDRVSNAISNELDLLNTVTRDDSQWDEAYQFVQHPRPSWGENNFSDDTLNALRISLIVYLDSSNRPIHAREFDPQIGHQKEASPEVLARLRPAIQAAKEKGAYRGLLILPEGPMLTTALPILTSTGKGPSAGTLIMGRKIERSELKRLAWTTNLRLDIFPLETATLPKDVSVARTHLLASSVPFVAPLNEKFVGGYNVLADSNGKPALLLRVQAPRNVYQQGQTTITYLMAAAVLGGLVFAVLSLFLLEKLVLSRLISLSTSVAAIGVRSGLSERIRIDGQDEISALATSINQMLASIDRSERERQVPEAYLEGLFESAPEAVVIVDNQHRVVRVNREFTSMFGYTLDEARGKDLDRLIVPESKSREAEVLKTTVEKGQSVGLETHRRRKDGSVVDVSFLGTPVMVGSRRVAYYGIYRNITDRKRAERLQSALYRIAEKASSSESLQDLFTTIHKILGELMYAKNCYVALYDSSSDIVSFPYFADEKDVVAPHPHRFRKGLTEYVLRTGKPLLATPDLLDSLVRSGQVESRLGAPSRDWMGVPLKQGDTTFGVLTVQAYELNVRYGESEKEILTFVSQQIASAVLHQRNQDALRESESRFRALAEYASPAIYIYAKQFYYVNPGAVRLFGYSREELMAMEDPWTTLVSREYRDIAFQRSEARLRGESVPSHYEFKIITKAGEEKWVDFSSSAGPIQFGGKTANVAIAVDVTDRKWGEQLQTALYRIAATTSSAEDPQHLFTAIHGIVSELMYASNFYLALYDPGTQLLSFPYFVDEVDSAPRPRPLQKGLTEYVLRVGRPLLATPEVFQRLLADHDVETVGAASVDWLGVPLQTGDMTFGVLVVQSYNENLRYGEKEKEILTFVSQHVASAIQYKRSQQALRESEARYRNLVQSAVYGIFRWSLEDRFTDVNPALVAILGYSSAEEVLALRMTKDVYVDSAQHRELVDALQEVGELRGVEAEWRRKDERVITVHLSGRSIQDNGTTVGFEMIVEDITERRLLEEQLRQSQKMEAIGQLAGGVAHDFNNLLMVIKGNSQLLLEKLHETDSRRTGVEQIQKASDKAASLTSQLLAFGRKQVVAFRVLDLNSLLGNMVQLLRRLVGEQIELAIISGDKLGRVKADPGQLEQVIMNLALNARDAMPSGGKVTLETANVELDGRHAPRQGNVKPGKYVMLVVSDTGEGIGTESLPHIFEPFFTTKPVGKGTGLGLSTVYGIVKQSNGYILAESSPGRGATFRVYLPRVEQPVDIVDVALPTAGAFRGSETVLLVEDEDGVRSLINMLLHRSGYTVIQCRNAEEALKSFEERTSHIHLLLTDLVLPKMGGRELAEKITAAQPDIKTLFMSGYTDDAILKHGVLDSRAAFLQKPFSMELLLQKVRDVLGRVAAAC